MQSPKHLFSPYIGIPDLLLDRLVEALSQRIVLLQELGVEPSSQTPLITFPEIYRGDEALRKKLERVFRRPMGFFTLRASRSWRITFSYKIVKGFVQVYWQNSIVYLADVDIDSIDIARCKNARIVYRPYVKGFIVRLEIATPYVTAQWDNCQLLRLLLALLENPSRFSLIEGSGVELYTWSTALALFLLAAAQTGFPLNIFN